jgi:hypothetical protein
LEKENFSPDVWLRSQQKTSRGGEKSRIRASFFAKEESSKKAAVTEPDSLFFTFLLGSTFSVEHTRILA